MPKVKKNSFKIKIADEKKPTDDGRLFPPGVLTWQEDGHATPLLLKTVKDKEGHAGAEIIGFIDKIWRDEEENAIWGEGNFASTTDPEIVELIREGLDGTSVGAVGTEFDVMPDEDGNPLRVYSKGKIREVTVLPVPASEHTRIEILTASAIPLAPPKTWFEDPNLSEPTMITITPEGQIYGHVASWTQCHVGFQNRCVMAPRSVDNYKAFNTRPVKTESGEDIYAGPLTFGVSHAGLEASASQARHHYDNVNAQIGQIRVGEDAHGIWMAGALNPDVDDITLRKLRASAVSGDWRSQDLIGVLCVNIPGFPVPRVEAKYKQENQYALVAAGVLFDEEEGLIIGEEMSEKSDELSFDSAIAEFASTLEQIVEAGNSEECISKSKELLEVLTASTQAPESESATASEGSVPIDQAELLQKLESLEAQVASNAHLTKKISAKLYKK